VQRRRCASRTTYGGSCTGERTESPERDMRRGVPGVPHPHAPVTRWVARADAPARVRWCRPDRPVAR
jgi:hypothetical protein